MELEKMKFAEIKAHVEQCGIDWARYRDHLKYYFESISQLLLKADLFKAIKEKYQNTTSETIVSMIKDYINAGILIDCGKSVKLATTQDIHERDNKIATV